MIEVEP